MPPKAARRKGWLRSSSSPVTTSGGSVPSAIAVHDDKGDIQDPFAAFQTLRTLLNNLNVSKSPLSSTEHALSLRLLDTVSPFIATTPTRKTLLSQPVEILDAIAFHIEDRKDLWTWSLSCSKVYRVVHPRHFRYRVVRAKISSVRCWRDIARNPSLAAGIRVLEILDERTKEREVVPCLGSSSSSSSPSSESDDSEEDTALIKSIDIHKLHETLFLKALQNLPTLTRFIWASGYTPVSIDGIWDVLVKRCDNLKNVEILDNAVFGPSSHGGDARTNTTSLRSVAIRSANTGYGHSQTPSLDRISNMLINRCPNLEDLNIGYVPRHRCPKPNAQYFLSQGQWSHLRSLTLRSLFCSSGPQIDPTTATGLSALATFLAEHPTLEILNLDVGRIPHLAPGQAHQAQHQHIKQFVLPPQSLPRLKELTTPSKELALTILSCPILSSPHPIRPLETLRGISLTGPPHDTPLFDILKKYNLKRVELARFNDIEDIRRLVGVVPKLTWLDVGERNNWKVGPLTIPNAGEWAAMLSEVPDLVAFHGIRVFYESPEPPTTSTSTTSTTITTHSDRSKITKNNEIANVLAWKLPRLRRLDHWEEGSGKIVVIVREGEKVRWEVRRVKG